MALTSDLQTRTYWKTNNQTYRDETYGPAEGSGVFQNCPVSALLYPEVGHLFHDDMEFYDATATVGNWAAVSDGGTVAQIDDNNGVLSIATGTSDNDETYLSTMAENWLVEDDRPIWFEARVKLTEANTDDANIIVGLSDNAAANILVDDGAGAAASYDGIAFVKVDGGTVWQFETSNAGTQVTTASAGAFTSATWTRLGFTVDHNDGTTAKVTPYINGVAGTAINLTISGLALMHGLLGVKAGDTNAETLLVDYVRVVQIR